jgi:hypothetical protein
VDIKFEGKKNNKYIHFITETIVLHKKKRIKTFPVISSPQQDIYAAAPSAQYTYAHIWYGIQIDPKKKKGVDRPSAFPKSQLYIRA